MDKETIKRLLYQFRNEDYKNFIGALILNEVIDYQMDIEDITEGDIETTEEIYNKFIESDRITSIINQEVLDYIEEIGE